MSALVKLRYGGGGLQAGAVVSVDEATAEHLIKNGNATAEPSELEVLEAELGFQLDPDESLRLDPPDFD